MGGGRGGEKTYLCAEPESGGGEAERGRGEEGGLGEVEGEEDEVPEEILRVGWGVSGVGGEEDIFNLNRFIWKIKVGVGDWWADIVAD